MKITVEWLQSKDACQEGIDWFKSQPLRDSIDLINYAIKKKEHFNWANWFIVRTMTRKQCLRYAIYAAEQVIDIYEKEYPDDKRPRKAIEAAKAVLKRDNKKNRNAATKAAYAATYAATKAAYAATKAAYAATYAAKAAANAANAAKAAYATNAAAYAANAAAYAACVAAYAACVAGCVNMRIKILKYGLKILRGRRHENYSRMVTE